MFGGVYLTCLRRLRVYDPVGAPRLPSSATLHQRWYAWITWEERRRTGMACFSESLRFGSFDPVLTPVVSF